MKPLLPLRRPAIGLLLLLAASLGQALTLGRSQGVALIGRPLDLSVQLSLDAGTDAASLCLESDVFYADSKIDSGRVSTRLEPATAQAATVRVRSEAPVDEPVVTVYLRVGCSQKTTRRYVLLAEQPPEATADAAAASRSRAAALPPMVAPSAASPSVAPLPALAATPRAPVTQPVPGTARSARTQARAERVARGAVPAAKPAPARARLQLEPLDLRAEQEPGLRLSASMGTAPEASPQARAEAAALWQALNAKPEDVLRTNQRMQALEGDTTALRAAVAQNSAGLVELRSELERAQRERFANPLVYALAVLFLALLAAAIYAWRSGRFRRTNSQQPGRDWWRGGAATAESDFGMDSGVSGRVPLRSEPPSGTRPVDLDLSFTESVLDKLHAKPAASAPSFQLSSRHEGFAYSGQPASLRSVKTEELHDVQQQADFFVSLGEHDRAIEILRSHINIRPETSVVAWLDLLEIYHKQKRREDYEATREEFQGLFNAQAPSFDAYREQRDGLEGYQQALSRIVALWPSPKVLDILEESIFRKPGTEGAEAFGLEAYRELLLLHNIGKEVIESQTGDSWADFESPDDAPPSFSHTAIHPLSASRSRSGLGGRHDDDGPTFVNLPRFGLDIDLDEPTPPTASLPASMAIGARDPGPSGHSNLLDFDVPDVNTHDLKPLKPLKPRS